MGKSVVHLDFATLHEILQLPKKCNILAVAPQMQHKYLEILLESDVLPEVALKQPYPIAHVHYSVEYYPGAREFQKVSVRVEAYVPKVEQGAKE